MATPVSSYLIIKLQLEGFHLTLLISNPFKYLSPTSKPAFQQDFSTFIRNPLNSAQWLEETNYEWNFGFSFKEWSTEKIIFLFL